MLFIFCDMNKKRQHREHDSTPRPGARFKAYVLSTSKKWKTFCFLTNNAQLCNSFSVLRRCVFTTCQRLTARECCQNDKEREKIQFQEDKYFILFLAFVEVLLFPYLDFQFSSFFFSFDFLRTHFACKNIGNWQ